MYICSHFIAKPEPPKFIVSIESIDIEEGKQAEFFCKAFGRPVPKIIWHKSGKEITQRNRITIKNHKDDAKLESESTLIVVDVIPQVDDGRYVAEAVNKVGSVQCEAQLQGNFNNHMVLLCFVSFI